MGLVQELRRKRSSSVMRSAAPLFQTPAAPWAMMRPPRRTAAAMPKRSFPLPSIACRMTSTLTGALPSPDKPGGLNKSDFDASLILYPGRVVNPPARKVFERWFRFTGYQAAKQQDSDLAPEIINRKDELPV
jgi:hypothetical protein